MTALELENYFKSDKDDWFKDSKTYNIKVKEFWELIRIHKTDNDDFDFNEFIFPKFESSSSKEIFEENKYILSEDLNFWRKGSIKEFKYKVFFNNCKFLGEVIFNKTHFLEGSSFSSSIFFEPTCFNDSTFKNDNFLDFCTFYRNTNFLSTKFSSFISFKSSIFIEHLYFENSNFKENSSVFFELTQFEELFLNKTKLLGDTYFLQTEFSKVKSNSEKSFCLFKEVTFGKGITQFNKCTFNRPLFIHDCIIDGQLIFRTDNVFFNSFEFDNNSLRDDSKILLQNIAELKEINIYRQILTKNFTFTNVNLSNFNLIDSHVSDVNFNECNWSNDKLIIPNNSDKLSKNYQERASYSRQLKKNFENSKNWDLYSKAYRGEMLMHRKHLLQLLKKRFISSHTIEWFIYWIYGRFSGFTQSIVTPIVLFIFSSIILYPAIYYFIEWNTLSDSLQMSIAASIPYIKPSKHIEYLSWWIKLSETIINTMLLAFFLISLRKRFK
ncbi:hypothetical protein [Wenyingzhuangia sp. IMCC45574]